MTFRAEDGRALNALAYEPSQRPSPAVVLVPMLGRPKEDWDAIGQRLADANILAVAIDLPGVSDPGDSRVLGAWSGDVRAAITYLNSRPDVRPGAIGVAGASVGASLAAIAAATSRVVRSLVLVSPSLDYRGVRVDAALQQYGRAGAARGQLRAIHTRPVGSRAGEERARGPRNAILERDRARHAPAGA